jgi:DNA-binding LacI/PurR family transcriptional regulator
LKKPPRRPTQKDIAAATGVHDSTVCLALKNHPSIPERTRARIRLAAKKLGYSPDPMLSALAAYRRRGAAPAGFKGTLAWLTNTAAANDWRNVVHIRNYYRGASRRAEEHGYRVEAFEVDANPRTQRRLAAIFKTRNIRGILLAPQPGAHREMHFAWPEFSVVTFGYTLAQPRFHTVSPAHYLAMLEVMRLLHRRGFRRIGFVQGALHNERIEHQFLAGYLAECQILHLDSLPTLLAGPSPGRSALAAWVGIHRPEAIVTGDHHILAPLRAAGLRVPADISVACCGLPGKNSLLAGVVEDSRHVGSVAVDLLAGLVQRGETGIPARPQRIHVEGAWSEGKSLRRRALN